MKIIMVTMTCLCLLLSVGCQFAERANTVAEQYPPLKDWVLQDLRLPWGRYLSNPQQLTNPLIQGMLTRLEAEGADTADFQEQLDLLPAHGADLDRLQLYADIALLRRQVRLKGLNALGGKVAFALHRNFHSSFIGYTEGLSDARNERSFRPDSRLMVFDNNDGDFGSVDTLITDPTGVIRDVDVSENGDKLIFAWKKSDREDDYHIYEYTLENDNVKQLTFGLGRADLEPQYLPDGDIVFASTRAEHSVPCYWTEVTNLYRMDDQGRYMRRMAVDQVHTLYPTVLENGRVIYTRWDYNDRSQLYPHPLFSMNPDGTGQRVYYGGNSWFPNSLIHARSIPGTDKILAVASGHHTLQRGKLVEINVAEGRDEGAGMHFVAPRRTVPYERKDIAMQEGAQFKYPYPINDQEFLTSYTPFNAPLFLPSTPFATEGAVYGLYWMNMDGERELLFQHDELSAGRSVTLTKATQPKAIDNVVDYTKNTGTLYVHNVYDGVGLEGIPYGDAKKIRVVELKYRAAGVGEVRNYADEAEGGESINSTPVAIGQGTWDVKKILGDIDIETDGSALFEVPAMASIYLQVLDEKGHVIQTTRSWDTVQPGEKKACRGCHWKNNANFYEYAPENTIAWTKQPQVLKPFYGEPRGFSFIQEIQPILDKKCVSCHQEGANTFSLSGELKPRNTLGKRQWSDAYLNLTHAQKVTAYLGSILPYGKYYQGDHQHSLVNWISKMSAPTELPPYHAGSATSGIMPMFESGDHYGVTFSEEEYHKFAAWIDLLVPFAGDYKEANEWSHRDRTFYEYYENKRYENLLQEAANIEALLNK